MDHLRVRCPSCSRLYQIDVRGVFTSEPHFQCLSCPTTFTFDFPPLDPARIATRAVVSRSSASAEPVRACVRCGALSPRSSAECLSCHVLFDRVEGLPQDPALKVRPSLVRLWRELLEDYASDKKHMAFLTACREQDALAFARMKYEEIGRLQGKDPVAENMIGRIDALETVDRTERAVAAEETPATVAREALAATVGPEFASLLTGASSKHAVPEPGWFFWVRVGITVPFAVAFMLVVWGFSQGGHRNMVGAGIAIALLSYGVVNGFLGGFSLKNLRR